MSESRLLAGRYRLESVLGRGGMGQVWLGHDETLGRAVAVKEIRLPTGLADDERDALCSRMMREARLTARLSHPGVVTVYDVVSEDGRPFIVMELLRVPTLADEVGESGPLPPQRVAQIGLALLPALDAAHRDGIVHRDVKPSNVLLADKFRVVLSDFGIATSESDPRMTATGLIVGSPTYMSPERLRGDATGPETDMWSLGATLYAAAEGKPPFDGSTTMGTVLSILNDELPRPAVGGALGAALSGLLDKDPARRLDSAQAAQMLHRAVDEQATTAVPDQRPAADDGPSRTAAVAAGTGVLRPSEDDRPVWESEPDRGDEAAEAQRSSGGSGGGVGRRRPGSRMLAFVAVALVALVLGFVAFRLLTGGNEPEPSAADGASAATADASTTEPPTTSKDPATKKSTQSTAGQDVPAGFRLREDPLGFQVAVPKGWQRQLDGASRVDYVAPDSDAFVRIDQQPEAGPSAKRAWLDAESAVSARLPNYERIRIDAVDYRSWDAADWEFTWSGDNGAVHVLNRGIATNTRGFALYVSAPDAQWDSVGKPAFESAAETFKPVE